MNVLPLSPIDHIFTGPNSYAISFVFIYDHILDDARLRDSLEMALQAFWPLRSRLIKISSHSYAFQPSEDGLVFEIFDAAKTSFETKDIGTYIRPVNSIEGEPLTTIKLTHTPTGSVLGMSISHALVDGYSFFHFLSSWARIAQGKKIINPAHERLLLIPDSIDSKEKRNAMNLLAGCGLFLGRNKRVDETISVKEENQPLTTKMIREMREEAQKMCEIPLYDNDVITAYIWKTYGPQWIQAHQDATIYLTIPFDFRILLREIPRTYFGCALAFTTASLSLSKLTDASLREVACLVRKTIAQVNATYARTSLRTLEALRQSSGLSLIQEIDVRHPERGLAVTNLTRLPITSIDFGSGPPIDFRATTQAHRGAAILPADDGVVVSAFPPPPSRFMGGNLTTL